MKKTPIETKPIELPVAPEPIRDSVSKYIEKASPLRIDPSRVWLCACLLAVAERDPNCHLPAGPTLPMVPYHLIGAWFGLAGEECDPEILIPLYKQARKAMRYVNHSAKATLRQSKRFDKVMRDKHHELPEHLREFRSAIGDFNKSLAQIVLWTEGKDLLNLKRAKVATEIFNVSQLTFVWWRICLPQLVLLCTTSLYGSALNQYSRVKVPTVLLGGKPDEKIEYSCLGTSEGFGSFHFSKDSLRMMGMLLGRSKEARKVNSIFGEGVNPLMRKIREGLALLGLPADVLLKHGSNPPPQRRDDPG